ncbi:EamA family transporter [Candidatus Woesearchaeota archaeon]|nr:EamA family transporter [Candidatus Woesearchaeota archaeon]
MTTQLWAIGLVVLGTVIAAFAPILWKKASKVSGIRSFLNWKFIAGVMLYGLGTVAFIPALKGGELSVLYPFVSLSYVWVSLLSIKFLKEKMTLLRWIGIGLIILGVSFIGIGS